MVVSTPKVEKPTISIEIEYEYTHEKGDEPQTSWYYVWIVTEDVRKAVVAAKKHFTQMLTNSGWTTKVKIISIHEMNNAQTKPVHKSVSTDVLTPARSKGRCAPTDPKPTATRNKPATKATTSRAKSTANKSSTKKPATRARKSPAVKPDGDKSTT